MASDPYGELSTLTGARQTMMTWASVVECLDDVPEVFRKSYRTVATEGGGSTPPYTVYAPPMEGPSLKLIGHKPPPKLLCELGDTIYLWERAGDRVTMTAYPLKDISDLEVGEINLYSWITIGGVTQDEIARSSTVEFNLATARHFAPFVNKIRPAPRHVDEREESEQRHKLDYLGFLSLKFRNYALESLVGGDKIVQTLWQPKISKPVLKVGGRVFYQTTLLLAHAAILTDRELIIIQDDERSREIRGVRYGGKRQYIALSHISGVSRPDDAGDLVRLCLTLSPGGRRMEIIFSASRKEQIAHLQEALVKLIG
jgi:hypothetical protein